MERSQQVTPSIRKSIVALSQYLNELNSERAKYEEELSYMQNALSVIEKMKARQLPIIDKMMTPIQKLQEKEKENYQKIDKFKLKNDALKEQISALEVQLQGSITSVSDIQARTKFLENNLSEYQKLFEELFMPYPLPYPYTIDSYLNWAIANKDKIILDPYQHELCEKLHNCSGDFNTLPTSEKKYIISLLRQLKDITHELVNEVRKIDIRMVNNPSKRERLIRITLQKYAVIALTMMKIKFRS